MLDLIKKDKDDNKDENALQHTVNERIFEIAEEKVEHRNILVDGMVNSKYRRTSTGHSPGLDDGSIQGRGKTF